MTATRSALPAMTPRSWVTRMTAIFRRWRRSSRSSRICFWIVTSSAVVGSSAIRSLGSQARAMAIMTRWRMPPDSWCGNWVTRSAGLGMPTRPRTSTARLRASGFDAPRWMRTGSAIWSPMVIVGFREVSGSWKIIPTRLPRTSSIRSSGRAARSVPSRLIVPPVRWPPPGSRRMTDRAVIVLPLPDSPTIPRHSPSATVRDTPSTARTRPRRSRISVRRSRMSRSGAIGYRRRRRTSNASRNASPMKLMETMTAMIAMPAGKICHQ